MNGEDINEEIDRSFDPTSEVELLRRMRNLERIQLQRVQEDLRLLDGSKACDLLLDIRQTLSSLLREVMCLRRCLVPTEDVWYVGEPEKTLTAGSAEEPTYETGLGGSS